MSEFINNVFHRPNESPEPTTGDDAAPQAAETTPAIVPQAAATDTVEQGAEVPAVEEEVVDAVEAGDVVTDGDAAQADGSVVDAADADDAADAADAADADDADAADAAALDGDADATAEAQESAGAPAADDEPADDGAGDPGPAGDTGADELLGAATGAEAVAADSRPPAHSRGNTTMSDGVVAKLVRVVASEVEGVHVFDGAGVEIVDDAATITVSFVAEYGSPIRAVATRIRTDVIEAVESLLELDVEAVHVNVSDLHTPGAS